MSETSERKTNPASARKLKKQREQGNVAQAAEVSNYISQFMAILYLVLASHWILAVIELGFASSFSLIFRPDERVFALAFSDSIRIFLFWAGPVVALTVGSGFVVRMLFQNGIVFSVTPVIPKLDKISPARGFKRLFGMRGLVELGLSFGRVSIWLLSVSLVMYARMDEVLASPVCGVPCIVELAVWIMVPVVTIALILLFLFSIVESLVQKFLFNHEQRMTKSEVKRERKDQHGSPEVRQARAKFRSELERAAESIGVDKATMALFCDDLAVAIRFDPIIARVPMISAVGLTKLDSLKIRNAVKQNGYNEINGGDFVRAAVLLRPGVAVPEEFYDDLRRLINAMYG